MSAATGRKRRAFAPSARDVPLVIRLPAEVVAELRRMAVRSDQGIRGVIVDFVTREGAAAIGRPPKLSPTPETFERLRQLALVQPAQKELASMLQVTPSTLRLFMSRHPVAREAVEQGKALGRASIRRATYVMAHHDVRAAIWWGDRYLRFPREEQPQKLPDRNAAEAIDALLRKVGAKPALPASVDEPVGE